MKLLKRPRAEGRQAASTKPPLTRAPTRHRCKRKLQRSMKLQPKLPKKCGKKRSAIQWKARKSRRKSRKFSRVAYKPYRGTKSQLRQEANGRFQSSPD